MSDNSEKRVSGPSWMSETDITKSLSDMKLPAMPGVEAFLAGHRRNMVALSAANRIALEGAQAVARWQMEIMQQTMGEFAETMKSLASTESPQQKAAAQGELLRRGFERTVANMKELGDIIQRSNAESLGLLNKRFTEAMDEIRSVGLSIRPQEGNPTIGAPKPPPLPKEKGQR